MGRSNLEQIKRRRRRKESLQGQTASDQGRIGEIADQFSFLQQLATSCRRFVPIGFSKHEFPPRFAGDKNYSPLDRNLMTIHAPGQEQSFLTSFIKQPARAVLLAVAFILNAASAHAQGCVAAHGSGLPPSMDQGETAHGWDISVSYRWFQSDRHYVGTAYQAQRDAAGDQVINRSNFTDIGLNYTISPRYSVTLTVPYVNHDRSQTLKKNGVVFQRYTTQATGIGDVSVVGNAWVFDPATSPKGNLQVGFGFALPTGKDDVTDTFQSYNATLDQVLATVKTVDQSIQPGTGGYGIILSANGYRRFGAGFSGYLNASYTMTPQETNGVNTFRGGFESIMSISDTYLGRIGVEYTIPSAHGVSLSLGLRAEGVPVYDLIGGSKGFRRPGYSVAIDPGFSISRPRWTAQVYVPFAIQRNRQQSVPDKQKTASTGKYAQGDAAFADYLIAFSFSYKL